MRGNLRIDGQCLELFHQILYRRKNWGDAHLGYRVLIEVFVVDFRKWGKGE
jgi:hypothetical protein